MHAEISEKLLELLRNDAIGHWTGNGRARGGEGGKCASFSALLQEMRPPYKYRKFRDLALVWGAVIGQRTEKEGRGGNGGEEVGPSPRNVLMGGMFCWAH